MWAMRPRLVAGRLPEIRRHLVEALRLRAPRQRLVARRRLAPHLRQHSVVARALALRHLGVVPLEVLHPPAHVEREVEHPLLVVSLRPELSHGYGRNGIWVMGYAGLPGYATAHARCSIRENGRKPSNI